VGNDGKAIQGEQEGSFERVLISGPRAAVYSALLLGEHVHAALGRGFLRTCHRARIARTGHFAGTGLGQYMYRPARGEDTIDGQPGQVRDQNGENLKIARPA
jgi:hypothetical protein